MTAFLFLLGALVCHRLSLLITSDDGPARIFRRLRNLPPPKSNARDGLNCLRCVSLWFGILIAACFWNQRLIAGAWTPLYALAWSGSAILLERAFKE